jgi:hypothetical protein
MGKLKHDGCGREVPLSFQHRLDEYNRGRRHKIHLIWNPKGKTIQHQVWVKATGRFQPGVYEPRWEVWVENDESRHPSRSGLRQKDIRTLPGGVSAIRLMPYEWDDGSYADPFNENFFRVMQVADSWNKGRAQHSGTDAHFNDFQLAEALKDEQLKKEMLAIASGTMEHYRGLDNVTVGRGSRGNWRHRLSHR